MWDNSLEKASLGDGEADNINCPNVNKMFFIPKAIFVNTTSHYFEI